MTDLPADEETDFSSAVSEVLRNIGVTDDMVKKRRDWMLLEEAMYTLDSVMRNDDVSVYFFGSQSEGTTTKGMNSDFDQLICDLRFNVIHDLSDWKPNRINLLIVQDDTTAPGYCHLQLLQNDKPLSSQLISDEHYADINGKVLIKNTIFQGRFDSKGNNIQHGPASTSPKTQTKPEVDFVPAIPCSSRPKEARAWLERERRSEWPTEQMKAECAKAGCFLVPVGSRVNGYNALEWRISTHHAERCLMFSLKITDIGCYILLKMLLKSHINRGCEGVISSYMCKNVMLHCVEKKPDLYFWREGNITNCLNFVLRELYDCIKNKTCPHFIITNNNLMAERISEEHQQLLLENIQHIINRGGKVLFEILTDDFGVRLQKKMHKIQSVSDLLPSAELIHRNIAGDIVYNIAYRANKIHVLLMNENDTNKNDDIQTVVQRFLGHFNQCLRRYTYASHAEQKATRLLLPKLCTTIASLRATEDITLNRPVSSIALFKLGLISDVSSGWLKLATVYYSSGDINATESILRRVEQKYDRRCVMPVCGCYDGAYYLVPCFYNVAELLHIDAIKCAVSYCIKFLPCERAIVPQEMQQEYSRSTQEQTINRTHDDKRWMDFVVADSLPYLYFLKYKTYGRLGNREKQQRSLDKLKLVIREDQNLFHKETALNLLGKCWEEEHQRDKAFICYKLSLMTRPENNAAQFHIAKLDLSNTEGQKMADTRI